MASQILDDVKDFLDGLVNDLTGMHVRGAAVLNSPGDRDAVDALTSLPAGLIEQAQDLAGRVEKEQDKGDAKPKAKAKPAAR